MWTLKGDDTNELTKQKETHRLRERTYGNQWDIWGEGIVWEFGMDMYTLLYLKWITNKDLLYSTWDSAQCYVAAWMTGKFGGKWIHVYIRPNPFSGGSSQPRDQTWVSHIAGRFFTTSWATREAQANKSWAGLNAAFSGRMNTILGGTRRIQCVLWPWTFILIYCALR